MSYLKFAFTAFIMPAVLCASYSIMYPGEEKIIWSCGALSANRSYQVKQLNRAATYFDLVIYDGPIFDKAKYVETVQITIDHVGQRQLTGSGQTSAGTTIRVRAFGGTVAFNVNDDKFGSASGRCNRNVELN